MELNPLVDLEVNGNNLTQEFRTHSLLFYRYYSKKADLERDRDIAKARVKEARAVAYKKFKSDVTVKHTEKSLEAEIDTDFTVLQAQAALIEAEHAAETMVGAVQSMSAKKDLLIQLGADQRKERQ
jgi:hypothetical protein